MTSLSAYPLVIWPRYHGFAHLQWTGLEPATHTSYNPTFGVYYYYQGLLHPCFELRNTLPREYS